MAFEIHSPAFVHESPLPMRYTCDGEDLSPPLVWSGHPKETRSFALIADDPDAPMGTWVHWVFYNMPPTLTSLPEGVSTEEVIPEGIQGITDYKRLGYGGPCPPKGSPHRYYFKLYALDTLLKLPSRATKADLEKAMKGHILSETVLMGTYQRKD